MKTDTTNPVAALAKPQYRILKIATCPSLSGKSSLTYHVGCEVIREGRGTADADLFFRIVENTASGYFSQEWIAFSAIQQEFAKVPGADTVTSFAMHSLPQLRGRSVNTPAFLFAVLKAEGLELIRK